MLVGYMPVTMADERDQSTCSAHALMAVSVDDQHLYQQAWGASSISPPHATLPDPEIQLVVPYAA